MKSELKKLILVPFFIAAFVSVDIAISQPILKIMS